MITKGLMRHNEQRKYEKKIYAKYGNNVDILDCRQTWLIDVPTERHPIFGVTNRKVLWSGEYLRDAL